MRAAFGTGNDTDGTENDTGSTEDGPPAEESPANAPGSGSALSAVPAAGSGRGRFAGGVVKFFHGPMDCGKSTLALQLHYNHSRQGRSGLLLTRLDRSGPARISSRIGVSRPAIEVSDQQDIVDLVRGRWAQGRPVDYVIVDEAQFFSPRQIDQLAVLADDLQVEVLCWCGRIGRFNGRIVDGRIVREGATVVVADTGDRAADAGSVRYQVLCRIHHRSGELGPSQATPPFQWSADPLDD